MNPISSVLGLIYFGSEFALAMFKRARSGSATLKDGNTTTVLWIIIGGSITAGYMVMTNLPQAGLPAQTWVTGLAIVMMAVGLAIRWYSIIYLGRFFTVNVAIAADHQLIDSGPYRRIRHPSYTGALLAFIGLGLSMH